MNKAFYGKGRLKAGERNKTEARYEAWLEVQKRDGNIIRYDFEAVTFKLADNTRYTPDFMVMKPDGEIEFHEVKGAWSIFQDDAKVKIKVASAMFPFRFIAVAPIAAKNGGGWDVKEF